METFQLTLFIALICFFLRQIKTFYFGENFGENLSLGYTLTRNECSRTGHPLPH